jgi:hypothetical protein
VGSRLYVHINVALGCFCRWKAEFKNIKAELKMSSNDEPPPEKTAVGHQFERRITITRQTSPGLLPTLPKALSSQAQGTSTFPSAVSSAGLANAETLSRYPTKDDDVQTNTQKPGDNDVDARKANRSKKAFRKKSRAEAKKAEAEAKRATAKAELEEIGKLIAVRVTIMRNYDAAAERDHLLAAHGLSDDRECFLTNLVVWQHVVGTVEIALVDLLARYEFVDFDGVIALNRNGF